MDRPWRRCLGQRPITSKLANHVSQCLCDLKDHSFAVDLPVCNFEGNILMVVWVRGVFHNLGFLSLFEQGKPYISYKNN